MNVLLVDDIEENRLTLKLLLDGFEGLTILEARDGTEAVEIVKTLGAELIFMDILMPKMNGVEATKAIKQLNKNTMIVAVSALDSSEDKKTILQCGAEDYITKPIVGEVFRMRTQNYLKLLEYRSAKEAKTAAVNLFKPSVYLHKLVFTVRDESSLAEFWEHFLIEQPKQADSFTEVVKALYAVGLYVLQDESFFEIVVEENGDFYFFTMSCDALAKNPSDIAKIVKHDFAGEFRLNDKKLSFELSKLIPDAQTAPVRPTQIESTTIEQPKTKHDIAEILSSSSKEEMKVLRQSHFDKVSAEEYVREIALDFFDKLERLEMLEDIIDSTIYSYEQTNAFSALEEVSDYFEEYAIVIDSLIEFENLATAIISLTKFLRTLDESLLDSKKTQKIGLLLRSINNDISEWRKNIFVLKEATDIHYLDGSLMSSCIQLRLIFSEQTSSDDSDDMELF